MVYGLIQITLLSGLKGLVLFSFSKDVLQGNQASKTSPKYITIKMLIFTTMKENDLFKYLFRTGPRQIMLFRSCFFMFSSLQFCSNIPDLKGLVIFSFSKDVYR